MLFVNSAWPFLGGQTQWESAKAGTLTGTPRDALAPYSGSRSINWCLAEGTETEISAVLLCARADFTFFTHVYVLATTTMTNLRHYQRCPLLILRCYWTDKLSRADLASVTVGVTRACDHIMYTVGHKKVPLYFCPYFLQLLTNFQNSFTGTLCRQFAIMWLLHITHHSVNAFLHYLVT